MSIEGVWTGEFYGPFGWENSGVYVLRNGAIVGGSNRHYSVGSYSVSGTTYEAKISVTYYTAPRAIFGERKEQFDIEVTGELQDDVINAQVTRPDKPEFGVAYCLHRRADLPTAFTQS